MTLTETNRYLKLIDFSHKFIYIMINQNITEYGKPLINFYLLNLKIYATFKPVF